MELISSVREEGRRKKSKENARGSFLVLLFEKQLQGRSVFASEFRVMSGKVDFLGCSANNERCTSEVG